MRSIDVRVDKGNSKQFYIGLQKSEVLLYYYTKSNQLMICGFKNSMFIFLRLLLC